MKLQHTLYTACLASIGLAGPASAAPTDQGGPEIVNITTPAGTAARPDLNIRVPNFELKTEMYTFPSGLRVMFQDDDSQPIIAVTSVTDHGASDDPLGKEGIAHLVEHLWFRSEHGDLPKTWDILESELGCDLNAFTQYDITAYMTVCSSRHLEAMMKLESLRITDAVANVTESMVTTEVEVVRNEIRMRAENFNIPFFTVWEIANGHLFDEDYPYHRPMAGNHTTIRNCKLKDIQKFTEDFYRPDTTTMMVVGDLPSTSPGYLLDLMTNNFDLKLLHPDLKEEHLRRMRRENIENHDPENPDHWYTIPMDPDNPDQPLPYLLELEPRSDQFSELVPPDPVTTELGTYEGAVKKPMVVVAWPMPPGYQGEDTLMRVTGWALSIVVGSSAPLRDDPDLRSFQGCFALPSKRSSTIFCIAEVKNTRANAERIASRMIDQVPQLYDPGWRQLLDLLFSMSRMQFMADVLRSIDLYAAVGAGRATDIGQHAHFTGSQQYHSAMIVEANQLQSFQVAEMADKWLKRNRAAMMFIKPMARDEVAIVSEDTAGSGGHFRGGGEASILNPSVDPDQLTPKFVRTLFDLPDVSKIDDFKLPNGLRVVIMPHTEAPLVRSTLVSRGGSAHEGSGISDYADWVWGFDKKTSTFGGSDIRPLQIGAEWNTSVGMTSKTIGMKSSAGNLDGALWMIRERIESTFPDFTFKSSYISFQKRMKRASWRSDSRIVREMAYEHVNPGHPLHDGIDYPDIMATKKLSAGAVRDYYQENWQPANSTLIIVGNVDPKEARAYAIKYFGGWRPANGVEPKSIPAVPGPNKPPSKQRIVVIDDKGKTQTGVTLVCPLKPAETYPSAKHDLLGDVSRMTLFAKLREEAGVVYSPYAGAWTFPGGTSYMYMTAAIQNDSAVFAMEQYLEYLNKASEGGISDRDIRVKKLGQANNYVLQQQSIDEMSRRLTGPIVNDEDWSAFEKYADELSNVSPQDFAELVGDCADSAFIAFVGPKDDVTGQLEKAGYAYEEIDKEERYQALLEENDPKYFKKYMKQKEKEDAKKASSDDDE